MADLTTEPAPVTLQRAWAHFMNTLGQTNVQRTHDARKAANALAALKRRV